MANPDSERVKAWRAANPDRYRAYQRELMRKRREKAKAAPEQPPQPVEVPEGILAPVNE